MNNMSIDWESIHAALWRHNKQMLVAVRHVDPIRLQDLVGIDDQAAALVRNSERFLARQPANNVLLWGARGTGKSSVIKAILNAYKSSGLRLIQVFKHDLQDLFDIVEEIQAQEEFWELTWYAEDQSHPLLKIRKDERSGESGRRED